MDLNDVIDKAKSGFDVVVKKTEDVVNVSKLKLELSNIRSRLAKDYERLGRICYSELSADVEIDNAQKEALISKIREQLEAMEVLKTQIEDAKDKKLCPYCNKYIASRAAYCSFCGRKV